MWPLVHSFFPLEQNLEICSNDSIYQPFIFLITNKHSVLRMYYILFICSPTDDHVTLVLLVSEAAVNSHPVCVLHSLSLLTGTQPLASLGHTE